jgi:hypothetical protein
MKRNKLLQFSAQNRLQNQILSRFLLIIFLLFIFVIFWNLPFGFILFFDCDFKKADLAFIIIRLGELEYFSMKLCPILSLSSLAFNYTFSWNRIFSISFDTIHFK